MNIDNVMELYKSKNAEDVALAIRIIFKMDENSLLSIPWNQSHIFYEIASSWHPELFGMADKERLRKIGENWVLIAFNSGEIRRIATIKYPEYIKMFAMKDCKYIEYKDL